MSYKPSNIPKFVGIGLVAILLSPFLAVISRSFIEFVATELSGSDARSAWPLATDENARIAAEACGVEHWDWATVFVFDGPPVDEPHFGYEIESLPSEEVAYEGPGEGRSWDRTDRVDSINACLNACFDEQEVRVGLAPPAYLYSIQGPNASERDTL